MEPAQRAPLHTAAEQKVLKRITPPAKLPSVVSRTLGVVEAELRRQQLLATVRLGGSTAKGTYLKGDHDIDVFVRFSPDYDDEELPELLGRVLERVFKKVERVHGSRDYYHVQQRISGKGAGTFTFEFIPVLNISSWEEARNVTDMSPLHVDYVARHTSERPWLAAEIRLTKQFLKSAKIYGAESYIGGFSGHVVDLLNIVYGGFRPLLQAAAGWSGKVVLDPEGHLDSPLAELNDAKTYAPLVIVDPVQRDRNSAAALTIRAFKRFREAAKAYLAAPPAEQERFFTIVPLTAAQVRKRHPGAEVITLELTPQVGKKDVVGAKCFKVYQHCMQRLLERGFSLLESEWEFTPKKASLFFALPKGLLPAQQEWPGPPVHRTQDVARFQKSHPTTFTRDGRVFAVERREYRDARKLLAAVLKGPYVKERVRKAALRPVST